EGFPCWSWQYARMKLIRRKTRRRKEEKRFLREEWNCRNESLAINSLSRPAQSF
ncbi:hypothetical protein CSUI_007406, partial [Cystoisospora suis]